MARILLSMEPMQDRTNELTQTTNALAHAILSKNANNPTETGEKTRMDFTGLQDLANGALGVLTVGLIIGGIIAMIKGGNISKIAGILVGSFLLVGAAAVIVNWKTVGPGVTALFT